MPSSRKPSLLAFFVLIFAVLLSVPSLLAQVSRGEISGTVSDPQGAVIGNALVKLTNPATGIVTETKTTSGGEFNFPELVPGKYKVNVMYTGFETAQVDNIEVDVSKVVPVKVVDSTSARMATAFFRTPIVGEPLWKAEDDND